MSLYDNIRRVTPYVPGEQPAGKVIKLNTNECPYAPSPRVAAAIAACAADRPSGENGFYGEIKAGVETSHRH